MIINRIRMRGANTFYLRFNDLLWAMILKRHERQSPTLQYINIRLITERNGKTISSSRRNSMRISLES